MTFLIFLALLVTIWELDEIRSDLWYMRSKIYGPRPNGEEEEDE